MAPLRLGELWAVPIMLRLALIENLRRVSTRIGANRVDSDNASVWADRMIEVAEQDPKSMILVVAEMARSDPPMTSAFVAELARQLRGRSPVLTLALSWIEQRLSEMSLTIEQMVQMETRAQAADQVSIGNSITSLRTLDGIDWRIFVERLSFVERALRGNPQDPYAAMDFATRDRYRHVVERLARHSPLSEEDVARRAMETRGRPAHAARRRRPPGPRRVLPDRSRACPSSSSRSGTALRQRNGSGASGGRRLCRSTSAGSC